MNTSQQPALVLVNLGTPSAPTTAAVRRYLAEFLSDRRVIAIPPLFWQPILYGFILPFRSPRSAEKYAKIWLPDGSPLMVYTQRLANQVAQVLPHWDVSYAMRYGEPALASVLNRCALSGSRPIIVLPLYPQYSTTTTASIGDVVNAWRVQHPQAEVSMVEDYADHPDWVNAIAESIRGHWATHGHREKLMFSFHGLPQRVANQGDPYPQRCQMSAQLIAKSLGLAPEQWTMGYQSRFGAERWLQPYAEPLLWSLAEAGVHDFDVACPGFATDCLETLEEVALGFTETLSQRGAQMHYIPCLNDQPAHARVLAAIAQTALKTQDRTENDQVD